MNVELVVLNALAKCCAALPPDTCAFGNWFGIVFGEADPPLCSARPRRVQRMVSVCESECAD
jgi:hypothetical protein